MDVYSEYIAGRITFEDCLKSASIANTYDVEVPFLYINSSSPIKKP
jgi:hypothetical protein